MNNRIYKRIQMELFYLLEKNLTIRQIATIMNVSKSTVHKDLHERLLYIDINLFDKAKNVLKKHVETRHINGGNATRIKYQKIKKGMIS